MLNTINCSGVTVSVKTSYAAVANLVVLDATERINYDITEINPYSFQKPILLWYPRLHWS